MMCLWNDSVVIAHVVGSMFQMYVILNSVVVSEKKKIPDSWLCHTICNRTSYFQTGLLVSLVAARVATISNRGNYSRVTRIDQWNHDPNKVTICTGEKDRVLSLPLLNHNLVEIYHTNIYYLPKTCGKCFKIANPWNEKLLYVGAGCVLFFNAIY